MFFADPRYGYNRTTDAYGNKSSHRWDPRLLPNGLGASSAFYGPGASKAPWSERARKVG